MQELIIKNNQEFNAFDIENVPDEPYWNLGEATENRIHSIHSYPAKFPAFIPTKAMNYARQNGIKISSVSDIFCGCGTVALEAKMEGVDFWGCDINPVATLIATVKSESYRKQTLEKYFYEVIKKYESSHDDYKDSYKSANERLQYWFREEQYCDLYALLKAIRFINNTKYRKVFECIFSSILKSTSIWLTKSIKPQKDDKKIPSNVMTVFRSQFKLYSQVLLSGKYSSEVIVKNDNFLTVEDYPLVDLIITSPPYVTSYEYADLHQLSSLWLGYTDDYKLLRRGTIGSMTPDKNCFNTSISLNNTGTDIVNQLSMSKDIQKHKVDAVSRYFLDMQAAIKKCYSMLNHQGYAFFIIGDTEYKKVKILNSKHLAESLLQAGFSEVRISKRKIKGKILTPYRNAQGKFSSNKNSRQVYHEEYVVIGKKDE